MIALHFQNHVCFNSVNTLLDQWKEFLLPLPQNFVKVGWASVKALISDEEIERRKFLTWVFRRKVWVTFEFWVATRSHILGGFEYVPCDFW